MKLVIQYVHWHNYISTVDGGSTTLVCIDDHFDTVWLFFMRYEYHPN